MKAIVPTGAVTGIHRSNEMILSFHTLHWNLPSADLNKIVSKWLKWILACFLLYQLVIQFSFPALILQDSSQDSSFKAALQSMLFCEQKHGTCWRFSLTAYGREINFESKEESWISICLENYFDNVQHLTSWKQLAVLFLKLNACRFCVHIGLMMLLKLSVDIVRRMQKVTKGKRNHEEVIRY